MATQTVNTPVNGVVQIIWETFATGETAASHMPGGTEPLAGSIQATGTFGGASIAFQGSNDGTNWVPLSDVEGDVIAITSAGLIEFSTTALYIRPAISGGTGDDVDVTVVLRG